jgi:hypothetical protein
VYLDCDFIFRGELGIYLKVTVLGMSDFVIINFSVHHLYLDLLSQADVRFLV